MSFTQIMNLKHGDVFVLSICDDCDSSNFSRDNSSDDCDVKAYLFILIVSCHFYDFVEI